MLHHIDDVTLMEAQLIKDLGLLAPNISAHFRIAAPSEAINGLLLRALGRAQMQNFEIVQRNSDDVLDLLRRGEVNAGITSRPLSISGVASYNLPPMEIVACASPAMVRNYPEAAILKAPLKPAVWCKSAAAERGQKRRFTGIFNSDLKRPLPPLITALNAEPA